MMKRTLLLATLMAGLLTGQVAAAAGQVAAAGRVAAATGQGSPAEQLGAAGQPLSPDTVRDLVARLSDTEVRALLLERLDAVSHAPPSSDFLAADLLAQMEDEAATVRAGLGGLMLAVPRAPDEIATAFDRFRDGRPVSTLLLIALGFTAMMIVGWAVERLYDRALRKLRSMVQTAEVENLAARVSLLLARLLLDLGGILLFAVGALAVFFALWHGHEPSRQVVMAYLTAVVGFRAVVACSHFLLVPRIQPLRLVHMDDAAAGHLHRQNVRIAAMATFGFITCTLLLELGVSLEVYRVLALAVAVVVFGMITRTVLEARAAITQNLLAVPEAASAARVAMARAWPYVTAVFTVALLLVVLVLALAGVRVGYLAAFGTLLTVHFLPHLDAALESATVRLLRREDAHDLAAVSIRVVLLRALRILVVIAAGVFVAGAWGVDILVFASGNTLGARLVAALLDVGTTVLVAYVLWAFARIAIERKLASERVSEEGGGAEHGDAGGTGLSRLATLLPILRFVLQTTIIVIMSLMILSTLGVNIGPLLAGAGVVGLAVGFGAQTLVRDIVSGMFFLLDDAFRTGEYIDIGSVKGTVEKISLRSVRLRHHRGPLHTVPFGEIQHLTNFSRDWVIMKLEFRVPFDTDLEKVRKIFKKIGQDLMEDEELKDGFLEPFKSQGVVTIDDSALVLRGKFMTKPGKQFVIRRVIYQAVQAAFAEVGIRFADRRVTVMQSHQDEDVPSEPVKPEILAAAALAPEVPPGHR